jgi:hypothetical protein
MFFSISFTKLLNVLYTMFRSVRRICRSQAGKFPFARFRVEGEPPFDTVESVSSLDEGTSLDVDDVDRKAVIIITVTTAIILTINTEARRTSIYTGDLTC